MASSSVLITSLIEASRKFFVDHAADDIDPTLGPVHGAVVQLERHLGERGEGLVERPVLRREREHLLLGEGEIDIHLRIVRYPDERLGHRRAHQRPDTKRGHAGIAVDGALHLGIREVVLRIGQFGLCLLQGSLCTLVLVLGRMQFKVRNHPVGKEQLLPFQSLFSRSLVGLGRSHCGDRLLQSGFIGHLVDNKEHLALAHMGTLLDQHPGDGARYLRAHLHILFSFYHSRVFHRELSVFRLYRQ